MAARVSRTSANGKLYESNRALLETGLNTLLIKEAQKLSSACGLQVAITWLWSPDNNA